jgi:hypothetical protein
MDPFIIGTIVFLLGLVIVFGGYTFYKRNIKPGAESTDPHKFSQ